MAIIGLLTRKVRSCKEPSWMLWYTHLRFATLDSSLRMEAQ